MDRYETIREHYVHLMVTALLGETSVHLARVHGLAPMMQKRETVSAHLTAHGVPLDLSRREVFLAVKP